MNNYSFQKGEEFEQYVERNVFTENNFILIHRTNTYLQNQDRFSENTLKPDFKFRHIESGIEFYVEAKFRSGFNNFNKLELMNLKQFDRFKSIQTEENCPVFIIIGYGGYSSNPENISLIPIDKIEYLSLYNSFLRNLV